MSENQDQFTKSISATPDRVSQNTLTDKTSLAEDDHQVSTDDGANYNGGNYRRRRVQKLEELEEDFEKQEERRLQRERECIGGGFSNSEWLVAIDNAGEILCLHSSDSVQIIPKPYDEDDDLSRQDSDQFGNQETERFFTDKIET